MPYKDPIRQREAQLRLKKRNRDFVNNYKAERGCCKCGQKDVVVLDLHHTDPSEKDDAVSKLVGRRASLKRIKAELEKCVVICVRCHRLLHNGHSHQQV